MWLPALAVFQSCCSSVCYSDIVTLFNVTVKQLSVSPLSLWTIVYGEGKRISAAVIPGPAAAVSIYILQLQRLSFGFPGDCGSY